MRFNERIKVVTVEGSTIQQQQQQQWYQMNQRCVCMYSVHICSLEIGRNCCVYDSILVSSSIVVYRTYDSVRVYVQERVVLKVQQEVVY